MTKPRLAMNAPGASAEQVQRGVDAALNRGYNERWTVVNLADIDLKKARERTPSTNRIYPLPALVSRSGTAFEDFRRRILSLIGLRDNGALHGVAQLEAERSSGRVRSFREMQAQAREVDRRRVQLAVRIAEMEARA